MDKAMSDINAARDRRMFNAMISTARLDVSLEMLESAWRLSIADELPEYGAVIADDQTLREIEERARNRK